MPRDFKVYLEDILEAINRIERYTEKCSFETFSKNIMIQDAVARNLSIIGEVVMWFPQEIREKYPELKWQKIAEMRDILLQDYFSVDSNVILNTMWEVLHVQLPILKRIAEEILQQIE